MYRTEADYFDLAQIRDSGQVFRMYPIGDNSNIQSYRVISRDRVVTVKQEGTSLTFECSEQEYKDYWEKYFDLATDYGAFIKNVDKKDSYLNSAAAYGSGIRLLKQDVWEMMLTFIISQQKQIPSIRKCVEALCERFGDVIQRDGETTIYAFPTAEQIVAGGPDGLAGLSLGYRERYIYETSVKYLEAWPGDEAVRALDYQSAKELLISFSGIGEKVANCICLFGLGHIDAFPVDVHIKNILYREYYRGDKAQASLSIKEYNTIIEESFGAYRGYRGIVQQWMFAYELVNK